MDIKDIEQQQSQVRQMEYALNKLKDLDAVKNKVVRRERIRVIFETNSMSICQKIDFDLDVGNYENAFLQFIQAVERRATYEYECAKYEITR